MKDITCGKCGKALGTIEKARIMKGITFLCPAHSVSAEDLRKAAKDFGGNKSTPHDFMEAFSDIFGKGFGK